MDREKYFFDTIKNMVSKKGRALHSLEFSIELAALFRANQEFDLAAKEIELLRGEEGANSLLCDALVETGHYRRLGDSVEPIY